MTQEEQRLADDRMRADIARLQAEAANIFEDMRLRREKFEEETRRNQVSIDKTIRETQHIKVRMYVEPLISACALIGATIALTKLFL